MSTIAGRQAALEVEATLSPAKRKEWERQQQRIARKKLQAEISLRREDREQFYYAIHFGRQKERFFNPKFNFPDIHGSPQQMETKGWLRTLQQRHQPTDDNTQLSSHITAYKFRQRESSGKGKAAGQNLKDGTMLADASSDITTTRATVVGPLRQYRVVNISAGTHHALCVTAQGKVLSMGEGRAGQLGLGRIEHTSKPTIVKGELTNKFVVQCAAGASHSLVRTKEERGISVNGTLRTTTRNEVYAWGDNSRQQLGLGESYTTRTRVNVPALVCHGIGHPSTVAQFEPDHVACVHLSAGAHHSTALGQGGAMFTWGGNQYGQLGDGGAASIPCKRPKMVVALRKQWIVDCAAGDMHTIAVTESGDLWSWGRGSEGQLGHHTLNHESLPKWIRSAGEIYEHVTAGRFHTLCRLNNGTVRSFGKDTAGMLGTNGVLPVPDPGGMKEFGPLHCKSMYGRNAAGSKSSAGRAGRKEKDHRINNDSLLLPPVSPVKKLRNQLTTDNITTTNNNSSPTTSRISPKRSPPKGLPPSRDSSSRNSPSRKSPSRKSPSRKSPSKKSPSKSSPPKSKPPPTANIVASLSPVYKLGPSLLEGRHAETRAILHRAHHNGIGRQYHLEDDFVMQVSAGVQHSIAVTKRGLAYSFGFAGGNGRLGHGNYTDQRIPKHITMLKDDALDADEWTKRALLERLVDLEKHTNPEVKADSADPKDVDYARPHNRVSDDLIDRINDKHKQQSEGNFAFESMRAFRSVDKGGEGEIDWGKVRPALNAMRIPLRSWYNPFSLCRLSVETLCETVDEEESGFIDETGFIEYLVKKHVAKKNGMPRKKHSKLYRAYKNCRGQSKDLRPNPDGRSTFINALEQNFIDRSLEFGELISKEQCRKIFEYGLELEFNEDGSKVKKEMKARDEIPDLSHFSSAIVNGSDEQNVVPGSDESNDSGSSDSSDSSDDSDNDSSGDSDDGGDNGKVNQGATNTTATNTATEESPELVERQKLLEKQKRKKNPGKLSKKELRKLEALIAQPELLYGCLDLRNLGLTDKHVRALALALRSVPAVSEIDLRLNYISDVGVEALLETMEFHNQLTKYDSSETLCGKCGETLAFAQPIRQAALCLDCGNTQWRPAYLLTKVIVKENEEHCTPSRTFKWFEVDYDKEVCQLLANRLMEQRHVSLTRHEYSELHEDVLNKHVDLYFEQAMEMIDRMVPYKEARKKTILGKPSKKTIERERLLNELDHLVAVFRLYGRRMFEGKHVPRYGLASVTQILQDSAVIRKQLVNSIFEFFHSHVPLENDRLLEGIQACCDAACRSVDLIKWDCREMKVRIYEILYALSGELYEHYLILNAGATVYEVTSGHNCSYLLTREGTVVSMGSTHNIIDSFKEQIVTRLPDNFRASIEKGRADKRRAAAAATATSNGQSSGGTNTRGLGKSPLMLPSKPWSAFDEEDMTLRFAPPPRPGDEEYIDEDVVVTEDWKDQRYHSGLHHKDTDHGNTGVEDHDEGVDDDERAFSDRESELSHLLDGEEKETSELSSLTMEDNDADGRHQAAEKEEGKESIENAYVGNHFYQGRRRPTTAMQLTIELRECAAVLVTEQYAIIAASLGQDKIKEYKRIATEMQSKKEIEEQRKADTMRELMWNLKDILHQDAQERAEQKEYQASLRMTDQQKRQRRAQMSHTGGFDPQSLEDLFMLFPGANKRFVHAMYEANDERAGIDKTLEILVGLQKEGVFDKDWDPDEDEDVIAARKQKGMYAPDADGGGEKKKKIKKGEK